MLSIRLAATLFAASSLFGADVALLNLIPADAKVIGGMNVARATSSPLGQHLLSRANPDDPKFREFVDSTGFDPRRDLREMVFASTTGAVGKHGSGLMAARGVFNGPQILAAAKTKGGKAVSYQGVEIVEASGGAMTVVDGSLLLMGEPGLVRSALDRRSSTATAQQTTVSKAQSLMNKYDVWLVSASPAAQLSARAPKGDGSAMRANAMQGISEISGGATLDSMVVIEGEAVTRSEKDAQALIDVVKFLTGFATLNRENNTHAQQFEAILSSLEMRPVGNTVHFSARIPERDLEELLKPKRPTQAASVIR